MAIAAIGRSFAGPLSWSRQHVVHLQAREKSDLIRSIRAMPIKLVRVSKDNSKAAQAMAQEWMAKLSRQVRLAG